MGSQAKVCGFIREVALALVPKLKLSELRVELGRRGIDKSDNVLKAKSDMAEVLLKHMEKEYDELDDLNDAWAREQAEDERDHEQMMIRLRNLRDSTNTQPTCACCQMCNKTITTEESNRCVCLSCFSSNAPAEQEEMQKLPLTPESEVDNIEQGSTLSVISGAGHDRSADKGIELCPSPSSQVTDATKQTRDESVTGELKKNMTTLASIQESLYSNAPKHTRSTESSEMRRLQEENASLREASTDSGQLSNGGRHEEDSPPGESITVRTTVVQETPQRTEGRSLLIGDSNVSRIRSYLNTDTGMRERYGTGSQLVVSAFPGAKIETVESKLSVLLSVGTEVKQVIIHAGTNNVGRDSLEEIETKFRNVYEEVRKYQPGCEVVFTSLLPRGDCKMKNDMAMQVNNLLERLVSHLEGARYVDCTNIFMVEGLIDTSMFSKDGLHVSKKGTETWARSIMDKTGLDLCDPDCKTQGNKHYREIKQSMQKCQVCGINGHNVNICRHRIQCFTCGQYGHKSKYCNLV